MNEGRSEQHASDIYEMMLFHYLNMEHDLDFDVVYVSGRALEISAEAADLWALINTTAEEEARRS
jgi:hypothetical protein